MDIAVTCVFLALSLTLALSVENLGTMLGIVGATGSTIVSFILPGIFYFRLFQNDETQSSWKKMTALTLFVIGILLVPGMLFIIL